MGTLIVSSVTNLGRNNRFTKMYQIIPETGFLITYCRAII